MTTRVKTHRYELPSPDGDDLEVVDAEDLPLTETVAVARRLEVLFDVRPDKIEILPLAVGIDASRWVRAEALVLLHAKSVWSDTLELDVTIEACELDPCDPKVMFQGPILQGFYYQNGSPTPELSVRVLATPLPRLLAVNLSVLPGFEEVATVQSVTLSVYLTGTLSGRHPSFRAASSRAEPDGGGAAERVDRPATNEVTRWLAARRAGQSVS